MNGTNKRVNTSSAANLCIKLAGTLGFASVGALLAFPAFSASPFFSKVNSSEAPHSLVAQSTGSGAPRSDTVPNLDRGGTPGGTATPSGTRTNPSSAPAAEPSNIGPTQDRSTTPGSSTGSPSAAPSGTPTNPSAAPRGSGGSGADVIIPSSGDSSGGMNMPTPAQGGSISPGGSDPTDSTKTPSSFPGGNPDRSTTPSTTDGTRSPSYTPNGTTSPSYTPDRTMTTPSSTPDSTTTTPSSAPSSGSGNGGVRALW